MFEVVIVVEPEDLGRQSQIPTILPLRHQQFRQHVLTLLPDLLPANISDESIKKKNKKKTITADSAKEAKDCQQQITAISGLLSQFSMYQL